MCRKMKMVISSRQKKILLLQTNPRCIARNVGYNGYYLSRANNGNNIYEMQFKFNLAIRNTSSSFYEEVKLVSESSSGYYCSGAQYTVIPPS